MDTTIYYFTGTGNSLKVAKDLAEGLPNTQLIQIRRDNLSSNTKPSSKKIGIIFPVYYYGLPFMVREFVENLKISKETYVFTIATCGGSVGASIGQMERILHSRDIKLSAAFKILMPDNYQVMYSPPSKDKQQRYFDMQKQSMEKIAGIIKENKTIPFNEKGKYFTKAFGDLVYKAFKPHNKDKNFWTDEKCDGCGICARLCPADDIEMKGGKPSWLGRCEHCLGCMQWCPKQSIQYNKGTMKRPRYHHPEIGVKELFSKERK